jgi:hypothetical protein
MTLDGEGYTNLVGSGSAGLGESLELTE